jgi:hypothetical protein
MVGLVAWAKEPTAIKQQHTNLNKCFIQQA